MRHGKAEISNVEIDPETGDLHVQCVSHEDAELVMKNLRSLCAPGTLFEITVEHKVIGRVRRRS